MMSDNNKLVLLPAVIEAIIPEEIPNESIRPIKQIIAVVSQSRGEFGHIVKSLPIGIEYVCVTDVCDFRGRVFSGYTETPFARRGRNYYDIMHYLQNLLKLKLDY